MNQTISKEVKLFCATLVVCMLLYIATPFIQLAIFSSMLEHRDEARPNVPALRGSAPELRKESDRL